MRGIKKIAITRRVRIDANSSTWFCSSNTRCTAWLTAPDGGLPLVDDQLDYHFRKVTGIRDEKGIHPSRGKRKERVLQSFHSRRLATTIKHQDKNRDPRRKSYNEQLQPYTTQGTSSRRNVHTSHLHAISDDVNRPEESNELI
ncbi:hypothetical protein J6590_069226 [Homalodisca vitripennis]|nr:hypothetical protein J6590_102592 [Homalodisca vitripennis]KAG8330173.1 hypothetical protein J6590_069226 [Homalodisca vitripennis]